jgi:hypothetical protein
MCAGEEGWGTERARGEKRGLKERREDDGREEVWSGRYEGREELKVRKAIGTLSLKSKNHAH